MGFLKVKQVVLMDQNGIYRELWTQESCLNLVEIFYELCASKAISCSKLTAKIIIISEIIKSKLFNKAYKLLEIFCRY